MTLWCLGRLDEAAARTKAALELAGEPGLEHSIANALMQAARLHQLLRKPDEVQSYAERSLALAQERALAYQLAVAAILRGWALTELGQHAEGIEQLRAGLERHRATGADMDRPYFLALLAEGRVSEGRRDEALAAVEEALGLVGGGRSFFYEAELHRLRGVLSVDRAAAERELRAALEISRRQRARSLELRAATSLGSLLHRQGDTGEALDVLRPVLDWFGEGVDTPDLVDARRLVRRLS